LILPPPAALLRTKPDKPKGAPLRSPEPPGIQARQEGKVSLTPEVALVRDGTNKTVVLEKVSITNRKSGTLLTLGAPAELGSLLTKAVAKATVAQSELETKPQPTPSSFYATMPSPAFETTQVAFPSPITKPGPTTLAPKLEELKKTEASIQAQTSKARHRSSSSLIGYSLGGVGGLSLVSAVVFTSTVLAFIGLGLTFWGALLLFIRPRHYVRSDLMDSTALSSLTTIDRMITSLGYTQKGVYIPVDNAEKAVVFIPAQPLKKIPNLDLVGKQTFLKDPEGIAMVPPGLALANLFERELKVKFSDWSLEKMAEQLPKLLIENLEMVQDCTIKIDGDKVNFTFVESVYSEFCNKLRSTTKVCSSLGCPMCSAMACVLAEVTHRPVEFDKDKYTTDGGTVESSYHILPG